VEFGTISLLSIAGLAVLWRRRRLDAFAPAWVFACVWMLSTILFFLFSRYRLPGIPALIVLSAVPVVAILDARRAGDRRWPLPATLAALAFLLSLLPVGKPRVDLVEFNLGRLAHERGDTAEAEAHYRAALDDDPKSLLACMNLGTIAAGRQDWPAALAYYRRAEAIEPDSDDVQCDLGGVLLAMGEIDQAASHLDRALTLNSQNLMALQNKAVLLLRRGDVAGAKELNRRLLELDPESPPGLRMKDRLADAQRVAGG
jgi:tetratricopeptide (TPR) repeat protein